MLSPVVLKDAPDILQEGHRQQHDDEKHHPDHAVDQIECDPRMRFYFPKICLDRLHPRGAIRNGGRISPAGPDETEIR